MRPVNEGFLFVLLELYHRAQLATEEFSWVHGGPLEGPCYLSHVVHVRTDAISSAFDLRKQLRHLITVVGVLLVARDVYVLHLRSL